MRDTKNYIVNYSVNMDVKSASEGLSSIAGMAERLEGPLKTLRESVAQVSQSIYQLKQNSSFVFEPVIDQKGFQKQLNEMRDRVKAVASEMHSAMYNALSGNQSARGGMQKAAEMALKEAKSIGVLRAELAELESRKDKILGAKIKGTKKRDNDGKLTKARLTKDFAGALSLQSELDSIENEKRALSKQLFEAEKLAKETEEISKKLGQTQKTIEKTSGNTKKNQAISAPTTSKNVTPGLIREWERVFGNSKGKTLTLSINATASGSKGAITVIGEVQKALDKLGTSATFNINPVLNMEGFALAENKLKSLAQLSNAVVAPFAPKNAVEGKVSAKKLTGDEKAQLKEAKANIDSYNKKIEAITSKLNKHKLKYESSPNNASKGWDTRFKNDLQKLNDQKSEKESVIAKLQEKTKIPTQSSAGKSSPMIIDLVGKIRDIDFDGKIPKLPVDVKITKTQIAQSLKEIPRLSMPIAIKLMWERGVVGRQEQFKKITESVPPVVIKLDTSSAIVALEEFISLVQSKAIQKISLKVSGNLGGLIKDNTSSPRTVSGGTVRQGAALVSEIKDGIVITDDPAALRYDKQKEQAWKNYAKKKTDSRFLLSKSKEYQQKDQAWNDYRQSLYEKLFGVPSISEDWVTQSQGQRATELKSMSDDAMHAFSHQTPYEKALSDAKNRAFEESYSRHRGIAGDLRSRAYNSVLPFVNSREQANLVVENRKFFKEAASRTGIDLLNNPSLKDQIKYFEAVSNQMKTANRQVPWQLQSHINRLNEDEAKRLKGIQEERAAELEAKRTRESSASIERHRKQIEKLRANAYNSVLPFASSKEQANLMVENRKFFRDASLKTGITPSANLSLRDQIKYLEAVSNQMKSAKKAVPWQLQNNINKLKEQYSNAVNANYERLKAEAEKKRIGEVNRSIERHGRQAERLRTKAYNSFLPFAESKEQLNTLLKHRKFLKEAFDSKGINYGDWNRIPLQDKYSVLQSAMSSMRAKNVQIPQAMHKKAEGYANELFDIQKEGQQKKSLESIKRHAKEIDRLRAQAFNAMAPFAESKEQIKDLVKYRKFFKNSLKKADVDSYADMHVFKKYFYLKDVIEEMEKARVAVPQQLRKKMKKISAEFDAEVDRINSGGSGGSGSYGSGGSGGSGGGRGGRGRRRGGSDMDFYDKSRKWAFPFTGPTSFGSNTPMAVEMFKGMGAMYAVEGAMSAIGGSFSQAVDYQNIMKTTQAILQNGSGNYSKIAFEKMEKTIRSVGIKTKFSAPEVADAAKFLAQAGYDINAINKSIRPIADLALIGDLDLGETADKMTNIMTTFQIAPENMRAAANIMATTATRSNTDLMMLAESAKYGGGVANLYGKDDPNLFADTMALFGVMGNAGIQSSSAGTALRMMYQNIFNPNGNQKAILDEIKKNYKIETRDKDGGYRSLSKILIDISQRIPEKKMAKIVGKLFRITAQPGANATLLAAAGGDQMVANEISRGSDELVQRMSNKAGLNSLISLMLANRASVSGNISGIMAEEKQNTIQGLWAQVTSTFTEAVLRAFEARKDEFEQMLANLREYFSKPETLRTIQTFMDAIVEIGKTMAWFAEIWAKMYSTAPGLITMWIKFQLFFTQVGALVSPFISFFGIFNRLGEIIKWLAGVSSVSTSSKVSSYASAILDAKEKFGTPLTIGSKSNGTLITLAGGAALRAQQEMKQNETLASELALSGASKEDILELLNNDTIEHYKEVKRRAKRRYGTGRIGRAFSDGKKTSILSILKKALGGVQNLFIGFAANFAKVAGMIWNPAGLIITVLTGLGAGFAYFHNKINGNLEYQQVLQQKIIDKSTETTEKMIENTQWYQDELDKMKNKSNSVSSEGKTQEELDYEKRVETFKGMFSELPDLLMQADNKNAMNSFVSQWRDKVNSVPLAKFAIGDDYDELVGKKLYDENKRWPLFTSLFDGDHYAKNIQDEVIEASLRMAAINDSSLPAVHDRIVELYKKYGNTKKYYEEASKIRDSIADKDNPFWQNSKNLNIDQYRNIDDPTIYRAYHEGLWNIINSMINGDIGTIVGKLKAHEQFKNGVKMYSQQWWGAIHHVTDDLPITFNTTTDDGRWHPGIKAQMSLLKNGMIDWKSVTEQLSKQIDRYQLHVKDAIALSLQFYNDLAELGAFPKTNEGAIEFAKKQLEGYGITNDDAKYLYNNHLHLTPWMQDGVKIMSLNDYQKYITNSNASRRLGDTIYNSADELRKLLLSVIEQYVTKLNAPKPQQAVDKLPELKIPFRPGVDVKDGKQTGTPNPTKDTEDDKDPYKTRYKSQTVKPTQINININELAHFDRTSVSASSEEKDLMQALESKIADAVYKIVAEALNGAQKMAAAK